MTSLAELKARVEAAKGPDRELDLALALIHFPNTTEATWLTDELGRREFGSQQRYTGSIDAAYRFAEWIKPGSVTMFELVNAAIIDADGMDPSPDAVARGIVSALLSALEAQP